MMIPGSKYFSRSPIMFADAVKTPTLLICGAIDRNIPAGQALEFHRALRMHGQDSVLLTYPGEGHGVRKMPASIDYTARLLAWFQHHMPPNAPIMEHDGAMQVRPATSSRGAPS
ncbi:MAG: alpha/beta hydrolase family protein [Allosphingosinicella sp.]|uniref:alpha/beta hydrolase family protein n=1 Tax=Allosphingosinicella sp. TaxID=2823234 RepID=UPI003953A8A4